MRFSIVEFGPESDSVIAVYLDNDLFEWGDYYHDKMAIWIDGFLAGLRFTEVDFELGSFELSFDNPLTKDIVELGCEPPESWSDLPLEELEEIGK